MSLKQHGPRIGLLLVLVGALLGWLSEHTEVLFADGLRYVRQACSLDRGAWRDGLLKAVDHPIYPLEIVAVHRLTRGNRDGDSDRDSDSPESWQAAAQWASVAAGILLVVPLYLVARELFGDASAWLGCLLCYLVPLTGHVFADALSESTFLFFWTWGLWTALRFLREGKFAWLPPTIALAVLAYLTRPEGLLLPAALVATLGLLPLCRPLRISRARWWAAMGLLVIGPLSLVGPYVAIKGGLGTKPSVARLLGTAPKSPPLAVERQHPLDPAETPTQTYALAAKSVIAAVRDAVSVPLLPLALLGLVRYRSRVPGTRGRTWLFLSIIGLASFLALCRLHATGGYCTPRHTLIVALLLLPAAGAGLHGSIAEMVDFLKRRSAGLGLGLGLGAHVGCIAWIAVLGGLACIFAPRTLAPVNPGLGGYRTAGLWLRERIEPQSRVVDVTGWSLFYGRIEGYTFANLVAAPSDQAARWVVAREAHLRGPWSYCSVLRGLVGDAEPVAVFRGDNPRHPTKVFIFDRGSQRTAAATSAAAPPARR
jgi:hypothetical protein